MIVKATCVLCDKVVEVDVPQGYRAELNHYQDDKVVIKPRVQEVT